MCFPLEIIATIALHLNPLELIPLSTTSRELYALCKDRWFWMERFRRDGLSLYRDPVYRQEKYGRSLKSWIRLYQKAKVSFCCGSWGSMDGRVIPGRLAILHNVGTCICFKKEPLFLCDKLFVFCCDKNFVHDSLRERFFPRLKEVYLGSHPCERYVLDRFGKVFLHERQKSYKERWARDNPKVGILTDKEFRRALKRSLLEEMKSSPVVNVLGAQPRGLL